MISNNVENGIRFQIMLACGHQVRPNTYARINYQIYCFFGQNCSLIIS